MLFLLSLRYPVYSGSYTNIGYLGNNQYCRFGSDSSSEFNIALRMGDTRNVFQYRVISAIRMVSYRQLRIL